MGWSDDDHWAGEAYDFGMGYMCRGGFSSEDSMSDDDFGFSERCKGITQAGTRCKVTADSPYPTARTISRHGFCSQHLSQGGNVPTLATSKRKREEQQHPLVMAAISGSATDVQKELDSMQNDINTLNMPEEMGLALLASVREGHPGVVTELLCIGADLKVLLGAAKQTVESALQSVQQILSSGAPRSAVRSALERRGRLEHVKALLASAAPLPPLPSIPSEPPMRDPERLTVEELKTALRNHGAKVSGRKAELIQRVKDGRYIEKHHEEELKKFQQLRQDALARRMDVEAQLAQRSASLRSILRDSSHQAPTEADILAEIDVFARPNAKALTTCPIAPLPNAKALKARSSSVPGACPECNGWLGRQNGKPPSCSAANCPGSKSLSTSIKYSGVPFQQLLVSEMSRSVPTPTRTLSGITKPSLALPAFVCEMGPPSKKQDNKTYEPEQKSNMPTQRYSGGGWKACAGLDGGKCVNCRDNAAAKACSVNMCGKCCKATNCARHRRDA
eukprot:TRINITY_DN47317_c0_g1_i1.p1 TRINITY_DN47317_c0_g1~~TRINITY_DN47317_c0_g1_i1.p1  ORF type:complete len:506 (-),score=65.38 TRINITY_DN47317_c0_g1_i1:296-1813(-)